MNANRKKATPRRSRADPSTVGLDEMIQEAIVDSGLSAPGQMREVGMPGCPAAFDREILP